MSEIQTINVNLSNLSEEEKEQLIKLIKKANQKSKKRWRGEEDDHYYFISDCGEILCDYEEKFDGDSYHYQSGNYFKTEEAAEFELNRRLVYQELKDYALEHNEGEIDWKNSEQEKWFISYDNQIKCFTYFVRRVLSDIGQIYFSSRKIAQEAVKAVGEDRIKKYLFGVD